MTRITPRLIAVGAVALAAILAGCSETVPPNSPASPSASAPIETGDASELEHLEGQTLWSVPETGEQLADDDPDVQAIRTLVTVHSGAIDNRGAGELDESIEAEFALYTPEFASTLEGVGWVAAAQQRAVAEGVVTEQRGLGWMQSTVAEDRSSATAQYEAYVVFTQAKDDFLQANGIELGVEYVALREVSTVSVGGEWLISDVRESGLQTRTIQP